MASRQDRIAKGWAHATDEDFKRREENQRAFSHEQPQQKTVEGTVPKRPKRAAAKAAQKAIAERSIDEEREDEDEAEEDDADVVKPPKKKPAISRKVFIPQDLDGIHTQLVNTRPTSIGGTMQHAARGLNGPLPGLQIRARVREVVDSEDNELITRGRRNGGEDLRPQRRNGVVARQNVLQGRNATNGSTPLREGTTGAVPTPTTKALVAAPNITAATHHAPSQMAFARLFLAPNAHTRTRPATNATSNAHTATTPANNTLTAAPSVSGVTAQPSAADRIMDDGSTRTNLSVSRNSVAPILQSVRPSIRPPISNGQLDMVHFNAIDWTKEESLMFINAYSLEDWNINHDASVYKHGGMAHRVRLLSGMQLDVMLCDFAVCPSCSPTPDTTRSSPSDGMPLVHASYLQTQQGICTFTGNPAVPHAPTIARSRISVNFNTVAGDVMCRAQVCDAEACFTCEPWLTGAPTTQASTEAPRGSNAINDGLKPELFNRQTSPDTFQQSILRSTYETLSRIRARGATYNYGATSGVGPTTQIDEARSDAMPGAAYGPPRSSLTLPSTYPNPSALPGSHSRLTSQLQATSAPNQTLHLPPNSSAQGPYNRPFHGNGRAFKPTTIPQPPARGSRASMPTPPARLQRAPLGAEQAGFLNSAAAAAQNLPAGSDTRYAAALNGLNMDSAGGSNTTHDHIACSEKED